MDNNYLRAGKIVNTHALRGEVRVFPYCDDAEFLCNIDYLYVDGTEYEVEYARVHKGQALIKFFDIDDINHAEALVGAFVYIDKADVELEDGRFFIEDIKGCEVFDIDSGVCYGRVTNVIKTGANDVYEVSDGEVTRLVPKIDDVVKEIDIDSKKIVIKPLEGLFE